VKVFLVGLDPQVPAKAGGLGEATGLPVFLEGLPDEELFFRRKRPRAFDFLRRRGTPVSRRVS